MVGRRQAVAELGTASALGASLNVVKFIALPAALSAHELDVLAIGLLLAVTLAQTAGEPLANHHILHPASSRVRLLGGGAAAVLLCGAVVVPGLALGVLAPGFDASSADRDSIRVFALSGLALLVLWAVAGRLQAERDFSGLSYVAIAPNLGLIAGLLLGSVGLIAASMLVTTVLSLWAASRQARARLPRDAPAHGGAVSLAGLLFLSAATQLNVVLLRVASADLPEGSLGAIYIAVGVVALPVLVVAGSAASVSLPHWRAGVSGRPIREVVWIAALASLLEAVLVAVLVGLDSVSSVREMVDPAIREGLRASLPVVAAGVPLYAAAWYVRGLAIARDRTVTIGILAVAGAVAVPASRLLGDELVYVAGGYALSPIPWLIGGLVIAWRADWR